VKQESFEKINLIGIGTFSEVWHVINQKYKQEFAMKTFLKSKLIDKKCAKSTIKEKNLMSIINHPFIVNMYFSFQDNHYLYYSWFNISFKLINISSNYYIIFTINRHSCIRLKF
jgi:serine/threonine protein kinase